MDKSVIKWDHQTQREKEAGVPKRIDGFASAPFAPCFREDMLKDVLIFKTDPRHSFDIYVTDSFVDVINKNRFMGAAFKKIYPPPDPNDIRRAAYEKAMKRRKNKK